MFWGRECHIGCTSSRASRPADTTSGPPAICLTESADITLTVRRQPGTGDRGESSTPRSSSVVRKRQIGNEPSRPRRAVPASKGWFAQRALVRTGRDTRTGRGFESRPALAGSPLRSDRPRQHDSHPRRVAFVFMVPATTTLRGAGRLRPRTTRRHPRATRRRRLPGARRQRSVRRRGRAGVPACPPFRATR